MHNRHAFAALSFMTFLFLYVGMDALDIEKWKIVSETYRYVLYLLLSICVVTYLLFTSRQFCFVTRFLYYAAQ